jgi:phosphatidylglycerol lysyltransferase
MSDPVGPDDSADDAAWKFREVCDAAGVYPVFYQVDESHLGRYIEMGLTMLKLGEEGRVPLADFSLEGRHRSDLRRTKRKSDAAGLKFEIVPRQDVPAIMPRLKAISDAWLSAKSAGEKGFSLGFFNQAYLARYDMAVIVRRSFAERRERTGPEPESSVGPEDLCPAAKDEEIIAFANILRGANKHELSIDLMRYVPDAPYGVMELLFLELMLHGRGEGFQYFSLGMAPLSGVDAHRLGPLWNRASNLMFHHGEHFYNFQGLRAYKDKFVPEWQPKYLAAPGGFATARALTDVTTLISGGLAKLLHR